MNVYIVEMLIVCASLSGLYFLMHRLVWKWQLKHTLVVKKVHGLVTDRWSLSLHSAALTELREKADWLEKETRKYPLEVVFGEVRRVFANRADIDRLISDLEDSIVNCKGG